MPRVESVVSTVMGALLMADPFAFFQPTVRLGSADRAALGAGRAFARTVAAPAGNVAIVAAVPVDIDGSRLVAWMREIAALKESPVVQQIGRFSPTPSTADVQRLTLSDGDLADVARCRQGDCGIKLEPAEFRRLQAAMAGPARSSDAVQQVFRQIVVARVTQYLQTGRQTVAPPSFLATNWPAVDTVLREYPRRTIAGAESFLYWSKDAYGGKPIISVTHLTIVHGTAESEPDVLVIGRQVFATHYTDGAWSFTALLRGEGTNYLMYLNQTDIDVLSTWYGGLVRRIVERRLREEAVDVLSGLRRRLESGDPPVRPGE